MKRVLLIILIVLINYLVLNAQNLCSNGSFETCTVFPNNYAQICWSTGWSNPNNSCSLIPGTGSPDFYHTSGVGGAKAPNTWWANVMPHTGSGFAGFATFYSSANYREYIRTTLTAPFTPGATYLVTFWITNGMSTLHFYGTNNIGFYFSAAPATQTLGTPIAVVPQVETTTVIYSTTWTQVSFLYTPVSAYQNLCIGNFRNDVSTARTLFGPNNPSSYGCYYYIDDISITEVSPLPVELLSFEGKNVNHKNHLAWSTATEVNNDYFEIESSDDGLLFYLIGIVDGNGNRTERSDYQFADSKVSPGLTYYRLKQVDFDGVFKYSGTIVLEDKIDEFEFLNFTVVNNNLHGMVLLNTGNPVNLNLELDDVQGRVVCTKNIHLEKQQQMIDIDFDKPLSGVYFIRVTDGVHLWTKKIVV